MYIEKIKEMNIPFIYKSYSNKIFIKTVPMFYDMVVSFLSSYSIKTKKVGHSTFLNIDNTRYIVQELY